MSTQVVCISRAMAAGGEDVGREVAMRLGLRYVDDEIILRAAREAQVDPALVASAEQRQPLLQRILAKLPAARDLVGGLNLGAVLPAGAASAGHRASEEDLRILIRAAVHEVGRAGDAVIVAHAASMALAGIDGVVRVLVTASAETRAARVAAEQGLNERDAAASVAASDRDRREYFRRFYEIGEELPTHYDLTINTDQLTTAQAAAMIAAALAR